MGKRGRPKGTTRIAGSGRLKGVPNKITMDIRTAYKDLINQNLPKLSKWLDEVAVDNPEKALRIIIELSQFVIPKLNTQSLDINTITNKIDYTQLTDAEVDSIEKLSQKATIQINESNTKP